MMKTTTPSHYRDTKSASMKIKPKPNLQSKLSTIVHELDNLKDHMINETNTIDNIELQTKRNTDKFKKQLISIQSNLDDLQQTVNKEMELNQNHFQDLIEQIDTKNEMNVKRIEMQIEQMDNKCRKQMETVMNEQRQQNEEIQRMREKQNQNSRYLEGIIKQNTENVSIDVDKILEQIDQLVGRANENQGVVELQKQQIQDLQMQMNSVKNANNQQQSMLNSLQQDHDHHEQTLGHFEQKHRQSNEQVQNELNRLEKNNRTMEKKLIETNDSLLSQTQSSYQTLNYELNGLKQQIEKELENMEYRVNRVAVQIEDQGKKMVKDVELKYQDSDRQINEVNDVLQQTRDSLKHEIRVLKSRQVEEGVPQFRRYQM